MATVPNRQAWRAEEDARGDEALVQAMKAFGWVVHRHILPVGYVLTTRAAAPVPRVAAPNSTLYVKGRASFTHEDGTVFDNRVPGMFSGDRPDTPAGVMMHTALTEFEFWCFNWHANRGALPQVEVFRLADGEVLSAPVGQRVLLCAGALGTFQNGSAFVHDGGALVASGDCYGFLIGADRD
jgi:hypothetical protein